MNAEHVDIELDFEASEVKSVLIRSIVDNYLPINAKLQMLLMDSVGNVTDSIFSLADDLVGGGIPDVNGQVKEPTQTITDFELTGARIDNFAKTKGIIIKAIMETTNQPDVVKLYDYYTVQFRLGVNLIGAPDLGIGGE